MHYKVSVIIPVYNVEQYLEQCLDSIVNQTLKEVEIIIVDDGSKDRSREIVDEYEEKYADVFSIHKEHKGPGAARNSGMSCAHGDYLYFMDSDDCLDINALERLYQVASQEGLDLVLFSGKAFTEDKDLKDIVSRFRYLRTRHLNKVMSGKDGFLLTHSDGEYMTSLCIRFYDRSYLKKINIEFNEDIIHEDEDFIVKSPVRRIHKVKTAKVVKDTYTDEALELMRDNCTSIRDLAIVDLLASSGMRVGEMVALNREDINFSERECVVFGKGSKERLVYFDARTKIHLQNYLDGRTDDSPALFVSLKAPFERLMIGGVETRLRELGRRLNLQKVHPHKFRRTMATTAIDKGMPIEQVQQLLGHQKIDTTMHYAMVKQQNVKLAHRKYIG